MQVGLYAYGTDDDDPNHGAILKLGPGFLLSAGLIVGGAVDRRRGAAVDLAASRSSSTS